MIRVYIWDYKGSDVAWGHASMKIDGGDPPGSIYISYWPQGAHRDRSSVSDNLYCVDPIRGRTYNDDVADEGQAPDHVVTLDGLNETAIKKWWSAKARTSAPNGVRSSPIARRPSPRRWTSEVGKPMQPGGLRTIQSGLRMMF